MKLTHKQRLFADEYIKSGNAAQAYIRAGYRVKTESSAKAASSRLLTNVNLKRYIDAKMAEIESSKIADAREVLEFYARVLREEETEEVALATVDGVAKIRKKPSMSDKISVAKEIMKRYPLLDPMANEQLRKLKADVRIAEAKANVAEKLGDDSNQKLEEVLDKLVGGQDGP